MENNKNAFESIVLDIISDYSNIYNYELPKFSICITENIKESYYSLRPDHVNKMGEYFDYNGVLVPPADYNGVFTVLIDRNYLLNNLNEGKNAWAGTIIHEITHARDYLEYTKLIEIKDYDEILNKDRHYRFQIWTEFNARRHGYYFVRKYSYNGVSNDEQIQFIFEKEIPFQIKYMVDEYNRISNDMLDQIYPVVHFLGRLSVWRELFPDYFEKKHYANYLMVMIGCLIYLIFWIHIII